MGLRQLQSLSFRQLQAPCARFFQAGQVSCCFLFQGVRSEEQRQFQTGFHFIPLQIKNSTLAPFMEEPVLPNVFYRAFFASLILYTTFWAFFQWD